MVASKPRIEWYIGMIGFDYDDWRDVFYRWRIRASSQLAHYSLILNVVEIELTYRKAGFYEELF